MKNNEILQIKKLLKEAIERLEILEAEQKVKTSKTQKSFSSLSLEKYMKWLSDKGLSKRSVDNYCLELRNLRKRMKEILNVELETEIYCINDLKLLYTLRDKMSKNKEFNVLNLKGHHRLSAAYNNYIQYLESTNVSITVED